MTSLRLFRLLGVVALLAVLAVAVLLFSGHSRPKPPARPVTTAAVPAAGSQALAATQNAARVLLTQTGGTGPPQTQYIDRARAITITYSAGELTYLQSGANAYARQPSGCFDHRALHGPVVTNAAGPLLPSGPDIRYSSPRAGVTDWTMSTRPPGLTVTPHGEVITDPSTHLMMSATVVDGPGAPQRTIVTYPASIPTVAAPSNLCATARA